MDGHSTVKRCIRKKQITIAQQNKDKTQTESDTEIMGVVMHLRGTCRCGVLEVREKLF